MIMRSLKLNHSEIEYLRNALFLAPELQREVRQWYSGEDPVDTIEVSESLAEELRSSFTEQLARTGFDDSYNLTSEGALLERLIDNFA